MKSRADSRHVTATKIAVVVLLVSLAACETKSSSSSNSTATTTTTTTIAPVTNDKGGFSVGDPGPGGSDVIYTSETPFPCGPNQKSKCNAIEVAPPGWWKSVTAPAGCTTMLLETDPTCKWDATAKSYADEEFIDAPGGGESNTAIMLAAGSPAATMATSYRGGDFTDWYVPTKVETRMICYRAHNMFTVNLSDACTGSLTNSYKYYDYYWSSLVVGKTDAAVWVTANGTFVTSTRVESSRVRPVRAFMAVLASTTTTTAATTSANVTTTTKPKSTTTTVGPLCGQAGVTCKVGDSTVNGGKVFYVSQAGFNCGSDMSKTCHYMEVADASWHLLVLSPCVPVGSYSVACPWGSPSSSYVNGDSKIGGGLKSSIAVSSAYGNTGGYAAMQAMAFRAGGKSDWYLPNLDELRELCKYANNQATGTEAKCAAGTLRSDFVSAAYWSSTDGGAGAVNVINFGNPVGGATLPKDDSAQTRPIRSF